MSLHDSSNAKLNCNRRISLKRLMAVNYAHAFDRDLVNRSPRDRRALISTIKSNCLHVATSPENIKRVISPTRKKWRKIIGYIRGNTLMHFRRPLGLSTPPLSSPGPTIPVGPIRFARLILAPPRHPRGSLSAHVAPPRVSVAPLQLHAGPVHINLFLRFL